MFVKRKSYDISYILLWNYGSFSKESLKIFFVYFTRLTFYIADHDRYTKTYAIHT